MKRTFILATLTVCLLLSGFLASSSKANASSQTKNYSYGIAWNSIRSNAYRALIPASNLNPGPTGPDYPVHLNAEMWVMMDFGWVEVGYTNTYPTWPDNKQQGRPVTAYGIFWADGQISNGKFIQRHEWLHTVENISPDGKFRDFAVTYAGNKTWNVWVDGKIVGNSTLTNSTVGIQQQVGIEFNLPSGGCGKKVNNNYSADTYSDEFVIHPGVWNGQQYVNWTYTQSQPLTRVNTTFQNSYWNEQTQEWHAQKVICSMSERG